MDGRGGEPGFEPVRASYSHLQGPSLSPPRHLSRHNKTEAYSAGKAIPKFLCPCGLLWGHLLGQLASGACFLSP